MNRYEALDWALDALRMATATEEDEESYIDYRASSWQIESMKEAIDVLIEMKKELHVVRTR